jgi:hypothetical protein
MRISELLSSEVVDETGRSGGWVHDVRISGEPGPGEEAAPFRVVGLVIGGGRLPHAWGFAEGRATGPWLLRVLTARGARQARFVPAARVESWEAGTIRIRGRLGDLPRLIDELHR